MLLEALIEKPVRRLVVASSMSIYGEGLYVDGGGRPVVGQERGLDRLIARASRLALEVEAANGQVFNIGSGRQYTVREIARAMADVLGRKVEPEVTGKYRVGDIRHCFADIALARRVLGYEPQMPLERGLIELSSWLEGQVATDRVAEAREELAARGLTV